MSEPLATGSAILRKVFGSFTGWPLKASTMSLRRIPARSAALPGRT